MKIKIKSIGSIILLGLIISLSNCKKNGDTAIVAEMTATVNGVPWVSLIRVSTLSTSVTPNLFTISGTPGIGAEKGIVLTVRGAEVGTYTLGLATVSAQCGIVYKETATDGTSYNYTSTTATVTLTKVDKENKKVSGTFSGSLFALGIAEPIQITDGVFQNLSYK